MVLRRRSRQAISRRLLHGLIYNITFLNPERTVEHPTTEWEKKIL